MEKKQRKTVVTPHSAAFVHAVQSLLFHFIYSNFWIAAGAAALLMATVELLELQPASFASIGFVFFATWLTYGVLKYSIFSPSVTQNGHTLWYIKNEFTANAILLISLILSIIFFSLLATKTQLFLLLPAFVTAAYYGWPFAVEKQFSLRKIAWLKPLVVAAVWVMLTVLVPLCEAGYLPEFWWLLLSIRMLYIAGLCLLFEIKDMAADQADGLSNIPSVIGIPATKRIAVLLFSIAILLSAIALCALSAQPAFAAIVIVQLICMFLIVHINANTSEKWYYIALDGTMFLLPVFIWLLDFL